MRIVVRLGVIAATLIVILNFRLNAQDGVPKESLTPEHDYVSSPIDTIDMETGSLIISIPIVSYKQRGSLSDFTLVARSNSTNWVFLQDNEIVPNPAWVFTGYPSPETDPGIVYNFPSWQYYGSGMQIVRGDALSYGTVDIPVELYNGLQGTYVQAYYEDGTGSQHLVYQDQNSGKFLTMDGSGLGTVSGAQGASSGVADSRGNIHTTLSDLQFDGFFDTITDSAGNSIVPIVQNGAPVSYYNSLGTIDHWVDSVGRVIPAPPGSNTPIGATYIGLDQLDPGCYTYQYPTSEGATAPYTFCYSSLHVESPFFSTNSYLGGYSANSTFLTKILFPNGTSYTFTYTSAGEIQQITLPTGGTISYVWQTQTANVALYDTRYLQSKTLNNNDGTPAKTWTFCGSASQPNCNPTANYTSVIDPDGNETLYSSISGLRNKIQYQGPASNGILLKSTATIGCPSQGNVFFRIAISEPSLVCEIDTTLSDGEVSAQKFTYDAPILVGDPLDNMNSDDVPFSATAYKSRGIKVTETVSSYGSGNPGAVLQTKATQYLWQADPRYYQANFMDLPKSTTTIDQNGATASQTTFAYDENNGSPQGLLGNLTSASKVVNSSGQVVKTTKVYNTQGMVTDTYDGNINAGLTGNHTQITYDATGLYPATIKQSVTGSVQHVDYYSYDANTGNLNLKTDQNGTTSGDPSHSIFFHYDSSGRLIQTQYPDGGKVQINYNGDPIPAKITVTTAIASGTTPKVVTQLYDGFGRLVQTQTNDLEGTIYQDTGYNKTDHTAFVSNPYRTTNDPTFGYTSFSYDALGRKTLQCQPDNGTGNSTCVPGNSYQQWTYSGSSNSFSDENRNVWTQTSDALGRLLSVTEPGNLTTSYAYDGNSNLLSVNQSGSTTAGESPRLRSFSYDMLSRLITSQNPEIGTICYGQISGRSCLNGYDPNGNLRYKTDARGIITNYSYDALNRLTSKTYTIPGSAAAVVSATDPVTLVYDVGTSGTVPNSVGRLVSEYTGSPSAPTAQRSITGFDPLGRILGETQCALVTGCTGTPYTFQYMYDFAGNMTYSNNGFASTGIGLTYGYDNVSRLQTLTSTWSDALHPPTLFAPPASDTQYGPVGLLAAQFGISSGFQQGSYSQVRTYDPRMRLVSERTDRGIVANTTTIGSITISGSEQQKSGTPTSSSINISFGGWPSTMDHCQDDGECWTEYENGYISLILGQYTYGVQYGEGSPSNLATALASIINQGGIFHAQPNAGNVLVTSIATGNSTDFPCTTSAYTYSSFVNTASVNAYCGNPTMTGGHDATISDSGAVTVNVAGNSVSVPWGSGSYPGGIADSIRSAIQNANWPSITASGSGANVILTSPQGITGTVMGTVSYDRADFTAPSFTVAASGMSTAASTSPQTVYAYTLAYQPNNNVSSIDDTVMGHWTYGYDPLNRLISGQASASTQTNASPYGAALLGWSYDSFGNRLLQTSSDAGLPSGSLQYSGINNQAMGTGLAGYPNVSATTFQYDPAGNLTSQNGVATSVFDAEGRLCATRNSTGGYTQYLYNAEGRRVAKGSINTMNCDRSSNGFAITNQYLLDLAGQQVTELNGSGQWLHSNVYVGGKMLATYDSQGLHFHFTDWLGSDRAQTRADGTIEEYCKSLPFGDGQSCSGTDVTEQHFTGKERDAESGLDYFGARYYGSNMGRFMSPDWSFAPDTVPYADFNDPQSLNLYSYAGNNPLSNVDDDGHNYHICDAQGTNCSDVSDKDLDQIAKNARGAGESWSGGNIKLQDGSAGGSYKQTDVDLPGDAASNRAGAQMIATDGLGSINFLLTNMALQVGTAGLGVGFEAGMTALRAGGAEAVNTGTNAVYQSVNAAGDVQYVGRTGNFLRRAGEHAGRFAIQRIPGLSNLSLADAKAVEQVLIETHGLGNQGGTLLNKINSIASTNPAYAQALQRGAQILKQVGY